jgi:hypothetical protein
LLASWVIRSTRLVLVWTIAWAGNGLPIYLLKAYPVHRDTEGSSPIGVSGTVGEDCPMPMHVLTLLVNMNVFGRPACARRMRDIVPVIWS